MHDPMADQESLLQRYKGCVVPPMSITGDGPLIRLEHIVDAAIVAAIVFFAVLLGDAFLAFRAGEAVYITAAEVLNRIVTATIAFFLTFFAQWARARGIELKRIWNNT